MNKGFTLMEILVTIVIIGVLVSVSVPMYTRTIERSRATEAMTNIKAINDAVYVYFSDKGKCPTKFSQLTVTLPVTSDSNIASRKIKTKFFEFTLTGDSTPRVPGTTCNGTLAERHEGGDYQYTIYNPYYATSGKTASLACTVSAGVTDENIRAKSRTICESLGMYVASDNSSETEEETD